MCDLGSSSAEKYGSQKAWQFDLRSKFKDKEFTTEQFDSENISYDDIKLNEEIKDKDKNILQIHSYKGDTNVNSTGSIYAVSYDDRTKRIPITRKTIRK